MVTTTKLRDIQNFSLQEVYNALTYLEPYKEALQQYIYEHIQDQYKPKNEAVFYDVTNYYFEIDNPDELRKKGKSFAAQTR